MSDAMKRLIREHEALLAENQRLRDALADIATTAESNWPGSVGGGTVAAIFGSKARAALAAVRVEDER